MWAGIAGALLANKAGFEISISIHDSVYNTDFNSTIIPYDAAQSERHSEVIESHIITTLQKFSSEHLCKFLGAGVTLSLLREVRSLLSLSFNRLFNTILGSEPLYPSMVGPRYRPLRL
jgi:alpha,alpha-trehalose phosphorylase (configuration-retaining)